jgi:hypothetical protein
MNSDQPRCEYRDFRGTIWRCSKQAKSIVNHPTRGTMNVCTQHRKRLEQGIASMNTLQEMMRNV